MCSEESKDINTTNNCPEWDSKQADKNKHDNHYNWLNMQTMENVL